MGLSKKNKSFLEMHRELADEKFLLNVKEYYKENARKDTIFYETSTN